MFQDTRTWTSHQVPCRLLHPATTGCLASLNPDQREMSNCPTMFLPQTGHSWDPAGLVKWFFLSKKSLLQDDSIPHALRVKHRCLETSTNSLVMFCYTATEFSNRRSSDLRESAWFLTQSIWQALGSVPPFQNLIPHTSILKAYKGKKS